MKKQLTKLCMPIVIVLFAASSLCVLPTAYADQTTAKDQVLAFIENALPLSLSKYDITFVSYSILDGSTVAGATSLSNNRVVETVKYTLSSDESTVDVICKVENSVVKYCHIYAINGSVISDKPYTDPLDAAKSFLTNYQTYSKKDSTNLIAMLNNVDITKNTTTTIDNIKLVIANNNFSGEALTRFEWTYTVNGADYTTLQIGFQDNGIFDSFRDTRDVYTIGDTSVNISKEQVINIALKNLSTYSYLMPDQSVVRDFNVTEDYITAELATTFVDSELRPYWDIRMPLNQTYPGSVHGITAFVWANTGEIISYSNIAYGGIDYADNSSIDATPSPEAADFTSSPAELASSTIDSGFALIVVLAAIGVAITSVVIIKKKKK
ncbi:MAG: hypothetical protein NWF00_00315 [Candidatus Bathyarchaeota archaeon]|nr:hypothetical protein [Candidatus Bathyarchaeota archaeon]